MGFCFSAGDETEQTLLQQQNNVNYQMAVFAYLIDNIHYCFK